jgi:UDP-glucuronate 4-epimerase
MSVLVTGAAGFIGSHLTERLLAGGAEVVGLDSFDSFYDPSMKERNLDRARDHFGFTEVRGDLRDRAALERVPPHVESVVHLAARAGVRPSIQDPALYVDVNLSGTLHLLEFMRERGIRKLAFGSSSSVYGDDARVPFSEEDACSRPISPYAATKRSGELFVHTYHHLYGLNALCLRFFTVYGPRQRPDLAIHKFAQLLSRGDAIPMYGDGGSERDYTYIDDILSGVDASLSYLDRHQGVFEVINLGSGRTIVLAQMIEMLGAALGVEPRVRRLSDCPGDVRRTYADVSKAARLLSYRPTTPFPEGLARFAEWFRSARAEAPILTGD